SSARGGDPDGYVQPRLPCRPQRARPRDGDVAGGARRRPRRPGRLHAPADRAVPATVPRACRQRPPVAPARIPGHARDRRRARRGRGDDGRHSPLRRRGPRHRRGDPAGGGVGRAARDARGAHARGRAAAAARGGERVVPRALISVYEKAGVAELARGLADLGWELVSSGGTAAHLEELGLEVSRVEDVTGAPEMLGGRVKTLHPRIHGGILARRDREDDLAVLADQEIEPFDLVCVNLYPFSSVAGRRDRTEQEIVEMIDVGGPSMLRAAAKNFAHVTVVSSPSQYRSVLGGLQACGSLSDRAPRRLAG